MVTIQKPSRPVLEGILGRSLTYLSAVSRHKPIFSILAARGFTQMELQIGYDLLFKATGYNPNATVIDINLAQAAQAELDEWDEPNFRVISASLIYRYPLQHEFLFRNLEPARGAAAMLAVKLFLDRLDDLESSPDREATRQEDHAALGIVAARGVTPEERARLRKLIAQAMGLPPADEAAAEEAAEVEAQGSAEPMPDVEVDGQYEEDLFALYKWYKEWAEVAKTFIKRRDYLIWLGLAKRRGSKKDDVGEVDEDASVYE